MRLKYTRIYEGDNGIFSIIIKNGDKITPKNYIELVFSILIKRFRSTKISI